MFNFLTKKTRMIESGDALAGRSQPIPTAASHYVNGHPLQGPYPQGAERAIFGLGCFWGAERKFWLAGKGVYVTAVGYAGGFTANPTYEETCTGQTGNTEAVLVVYDPKVISYDELLNTFWAIHDPTTLNRQGNDRGTSYRSAIFYTSEEQRRVAEDTIADVEASALWPGKVVTELSPAGDFWEAEPEHQDYLERYPNGYTCHFVRPQWKLPRRSAA